MTISATFWFGILCSAALVSLSGGIQCVACVDGKVAHNHKLFERFRVPAKGQYPPCSHDLGKMNNYAIVQCQSSCLAAEIVNSGVYIAMTRFCADKVFFDNSTYRDNRIFPTVRAPNPRLASYEIRSRVCKTDLCNLEKIPTFAKPTTDVPPFIRFEKIVGENSGSAMAIPLMLLTLLL